MSSAWKALCGADDFKVGDGGVHVELARGRKHHVDVETDDLDVWWFHAVVAKPSHLKVLGDDTAMLPWLRNRVAQVMGFRIDGRRRLVANAWVPRDAGAEEFQWVVRNLARECDRLEFLLSGADEE